MNIFKAKKVYPKDVVVLHQIPRGLRAPSVSPYCLKLETWLRMADIKYQNELGYSFSSKSTVPWITFNGIELADSQFSIEYLEEHFEKNLNEHLTDEQKGVARAVLKMTEESLKWALPLRRFVYAQDPKETGIPKIVLLMSKCKMKKAAQGQGYGRHSEQEVYGICKADMKAINDIIGNKKFLFGDKPCDTDASVYGICAQFLYHDLGPIHDYLTNDCPNLMRFLETMKATYWPDWKSLITEKN